MTDMLKNPAFNAEELEKLKTEALAGIEQNKTEPQFLAMRKMGRINQKHEKGHPLYNMSIEEEVQAINDVSVEGIKKYYDDFYGISTSATLTAIGNIDENELKSYFNSQFADFKSDKPFTEIADSYAPNKAVNEKIKTPDKKNAISFGMLPFEKSTNDDDYAAIQIASEILGGGFLSSRIANRLRQQDGVSYGAGSGVNVDDNAKDKNSVMYVYAIYAPENAAKVQLGFKEEIDRYIKDGITEEELKTAVDGWVQGQSVSRAKDRELVRLINNNMYYDRDLGFQKNLEEKVSSLTVADVNQVIKKYVKPFKDWTVVNAGDFEDFDIKKDTEKVD